MRIVMTPRLFTLLNFQIIKNDQTRPRHRCHHITQRHKRSYFQTSNYNANINYFSWITDIACFPFHFVLYSFLRASS